MDKEALLGPVAPIRGLCRMTPELAQRGYRLSNFLCSLRHAAQRDAAARDLESCLRAHGLSEQEKDMVRRRDFVAMLRHGASTVAVGKACRAWGVTLVELGAIGRGQSPQDFLAERKRANQGQPWAF